MFALAMLDPTLTGIFFLVAVILFVLAAFNVTSPVVLQAAGLAFFAFPFMWNAFAAA